MRTLAITLLASTLWLMAMADEESASEVSEVSEVSHAGLLLDLPPDWQRHSSISPSIAVWRAPSVGAEEADSYATPSVAISQQSRPSQQEWEELLADIREQLHDIYTDVEIHYDESLSIADSPWWRLESSFQLGTLTWRQCWLLTLQQPDDDDGGPLELISVVFSSSDAHWPQWHSQREAIQDSLRPAAAAEEEAESPDNDE